MAPDASDITGWMIAALVCFLGVSIFAKPIYRLAQFFVRALAGVSAIFVLDVLLSPIGLSVGINLFTACFAALLGVPGLALLYGLAYLFR